MDYLFYALWPFVLLALVLGLLVGWTACPEPDDNRKP